jgi:DNA-binding transcriptional LysR family regulator
MKPQRPLSSLQLSSFLAVAEHGSIARAAAGLHLTPSALSKRVLALERELGQRLFERGSQPLALTAAGLRLRRHADQVNQLQRQLFAELHGASMADTDAAPIAVAPVLALLDRVYALLGREPSRAGPPPALPCRCDAAAGSDDDAALHAQ